MSNMNIVEIKKILEKNNNYLRQTFQRKIITTLDRLFMLGK
jgi:hypothetical protein